MRNQARGQFHRVSEFRTRKIKTLIQEDSNKNDLIQDPWLDDFSNGL